MGVSESFACECEWTALYSTVPGCLQEMETVGRGNARRSGVPCARNPLGTLTSNIWVSLLSRGLQQMRQCKYWCLAASGGWFAIRWMV